MLDVADEMGLMIQDETGHPWLEQPGELHHGRENMIKHLADLVKRDRNHASVLRWSQANEPRVVFFNNPGAGPEFDEALYQTVMALDQTRPISTDERWTRATRPAARAVTASATTQDSPSVPTPRASAPGPQGSRRGRASSSGGWTARRRA